MGGRRLGLIIGNERYDDPLLATLQAPRLDVELLAAVLRDEAVGQFDEVEVLLDAPERDLRRAIAKFCDNRTAGDGAMGGGIRGDYVSLSDSTISDNSTGGNAAGGGGIYGFTVEIARSTVCGNRTAGFGAYGGGIGGLYVAVTNSTVRPCPATSLILPRHLL